MHSVVELATPVDGFPAGRRGGVVDTYSGGTLLVETSAQLRLVDA